VWGLTATPLLSDIYGLFNVVNFVYPGYLGTKTAFSKNYLKEVLVKGGGGIRFKEIVGYKNIDTLKQLVERVSFIRKKKYNLNFVYKRDRMVEEEWDMYYRAVKSVVKDKKWAAGLHTLQRAVDNSHCVFSSDELSTKEKILIQTLQEIFSRGESSIVYVSYHSTLNRISDILKKNKTVLNLNNVFVISGKESKETRRKVEELVSERDVILATDAATVSYNIGRSNNVVFYNIPFKIGAVIQIIGRITRLDSQYDRQNVYVIEIEDTIDTYKRLLVQENTRLINNLFGKEDHLPDEEIPDFIDRKFLKEIRRTLLWKFKKRKETKSE
jgi:superfamily II DNA or RNA helicase